MLALSEPRTLITLHALAFLLQLVLFDIEITLLAGQCDVDVWDPIVLVVRIDR